MGAMSSPITSLTIVYSTVYSGADQRKHQSSASLAFVWGIHRCPVNSPHKRPVTRKMFLFDDVIRDDSFDKILLLMIPLMAVALSHDYCHFTDRHLALCVGNSPVTGEFPCQRPVTWSSDVFFDLRLE